MNPLEILRQKSIYGPMLTAYLKNRLLIGAEEAAAMARFLLIDLRVSPQRLRDMEKFSIMHNYTPPEALILMAQGSFLYDEAGKIYADFQGAYSANNAGNCNARVTGANRFAATMSSILSRARRNRQLPLTGHELQEALGLNYKMLPTNGGCEAIESAVLLAKLAFNRHPRFEAKREVMAYAGRPHRIIVCANNFHGRSSWAKAVSTNAAYRDPFAPNTLEQEIEWVEFGNIADLERACGLGDTTVFVVEPIQCEGGMNCPPPDYLRQARALCDRFGLILVIDEVQTGLGRTGTMLGQMHYFDGGVEADFIALAKSISGGQEVASAVLARPEFADLIRPSEHGSTFGGGPKACATIRAAIREIVDRQLCDRARLSGDILQKELRRMCAGLPGIIEVRGQGLAIGIEVEGHRADEICRRLRDCHFVYRGETINGCWTNSTHGITDTTTVVRVSPPLTMSPDLMWAALYAFAQALDHPHPETFRAPDLEWPRGIDALARDVHDELLYLQRRWHRFTADLANK